MLNRSQRSALFKKECLKWIDYWGLYDWNVIFDTECDDDLLANTFSSLEAKQAVISFNQNVEEKYKTRQQVKESAFHEVTELLLAPLNILAKSRFIASSEIEQARHDIIHRIERRVF